MSERKRAINDRNEHFKWSKGFSVYFLFANVKGFYSFYPQNTHQNTKYQYGLVGKEKKLNISKIKSQGDVLKFTKMQ